jgi:hypothetical protein
MSIDTFRNTPRLEADDLQRQWHQPIESRRVALRRDHVVGGRIEVFHLDDDHLKLSWSVNGGTAMESQVLTVHSGAVLSLRCPECKEFRRRLFFTFCDRTPFDSNWFHCEHCIDRDTEMGKRRSRRNISSWKKRDRRATRALHGAVASEPVEPYGTSGEKTGGPANN